MTHSDSYVLDAISAQAFARLEAEAHEAATSPWNTRKHPTVANFRAANWKHGQFDLRPGLRVKIENARGTIRSGVTPDGIPWENRMAAHYGDIVGTRGADGDPVDIFIGPFPESSKLWVINQRQNWDGATGFDEHKVLAGFHTEEAARAAYLGSYQRGWDGLQSIVPCTYAQLKWWLRNGDTSQPFTTETIPQEGTAIMDKAVLWDADANPVGIQMHQLVYDLRREDSGAGLLLDSVTMSDLMTDPDIEGVVTLDALVVEVSRMSLKMDMLKKVMEAAGSTVKPTEVTISDPVRARGVLQVMVLFQMSDGQAVSIWFHNPDTTPAKLTPLDDLVSWKWMLNKKDVTIVVAPERGQELNVREVARRIMRLVERNSDTFKRANEKAAARIAQVEGLKTEITVLEVELSDWQRKIEVEQMRQDEAPTPKERWDSARGHANAVDKAVREEVIGGPQVQNMEVFREVTALLGSLRELAAGTTEAASPEELRAKVDELAVQIRAKLEEAAKAPAQAAPAPEPTPAPEPAAASESVLAGLGVGHDDIAAIAEDGGYPAIRDDERLALKWQDTLDSAFQQRLVDVRNALRELGWKGTGAALSKEVGGSVYGIKHDVQQVGAGANVVGVTWVVNEHTREVDNLDKRAPLMAATLEGLLQMAISDAREAATAPAVDPDAGRPSWEKGKTDAEIASDKLWKLGRELAGTIYEESRLQDFRPTELPEVVSMWAKDAGVSADDLRKSLLEGLSQFDFSEGRLRQIRAVLDPASAAASFTWTVERARDAGKKAFAEGAERMVPFSAPDDISQAWVDGYDAAKDLQDILNKQKAEAEAADAAAAAAAAGLPTDAELQAAAEAGAEVSRIAYNPSLPKAEREGKPLATLKTADGKHLIFLYTDADVGRAVRAVHDAEDMRNYRPFDPSELKMPTAVQLGLKSAKTPPVLIVSDTDKSVVLDGWSNGHMIDLVGRPGFIQKALDQYVNDPSIGARRIPISAVEKIEAQAKSRSTQVLPIAHYDFEEAEHVTSGTIHKNSNKRIPRNSLVLEAADGAAWVWLDERYVAYFWKTYKGCDFFADGPEASVAVRHHGKLVGIIMPRNVKGADAILQRAKRAKAKAEVAQDPDALTASQVDAAYRFEDATEAFKIAVAHSVGETSYSAFLTARNMDERAKALGLTVSWDVQEIALDSVAGGQSLFDDAGEESIAEVFNTCVGTVKRAGEVIGRAVVSDGDGKAMVYVGAAGNQRVTYVSSMDGVRRNAMWSDDDAVDMIDWLVENLAFAQAQAQAEPEAAAEEEDDNIGRTWRSPEGVKEVVGFKDGKYQIQIDEERPGLGIDPDDLEQEIRDDKRAIEEFEQMAAEQRAREQADKEPVPELIAAGFTRIGDKGQEYGKSVDVSHTTVLRFNVKRVGGGGYPAGWAVRMSPTFKNGVTGAPSQDLGRFETPAQAVAVVDAELEKRKPAAAPVAEDAPMNQLRPIEPQSPERIEWENAVTEAVIRLAEVSRGDAQAMLEADPDRLAKFWEGKADSDWTAEQITGITPAAAAPAPKGDISYREVDDMFTSFFPDSKAGEDAWAVINATPGSENGKVLTTHAASVIEQLQAAGYTVTRATAPTVSDDELAAELAAPAAVDPAKDADRAYLQTLIDGSADYFDTGILDRLEPMFAKYDGDAEMQELLTQAAEAYSNAATAAAKEALGAV